MFDEESGNQLAQELVAGCEETYPPEEVDKDVQAAVREKIRGNPKLNSRRNSGSVLEAYLALPAPLTCQPPETSHQHVAELLPNLPLEVATWFPTPAQEGGGSAR